MIVLFYLIPTLFLLFFAVYTDNQIKDEVDNDLSYNKLDARWHRAGLLMRSVFFLAMVVWVLPVKQFISWRHLVVLAPVMAIEWDMFINVIRGRKIFDVGEGGSDKRVGKRKWVAYFIWLVLSIIPFFFN